MGDCWSKRPEKEEHVKSSCRRCEQHELEQKNKESLAEKETFYRVKLNEARSALKQKEEELKSFKDSLAEMETFYKERLNEARSALKQKEEELKSFKDSLAEMETFYKEKLNEARSALKQKEEELKSFKDSKRPEKEEHVKSSCRRCEQHELEHKESLAEMETFYKEKLNEARSALKQKEEELKSFKDSLAEMETFYKEKLNEARCALKQKEDRVAGDLAVSIKTGDTESMNNPVSKTRLTEMYNELRLLQWPKIKDYLKSDDVKSESAKALIQKMFEDASNQMEQKKKQIDEVLGLNEHSSGRTPQKVKEYRQLTIQNLQMALFHSRKEDVLKTYSPDFEAQCPQRERINFTHLASECYWLGCLMALNNPPLQPDWENHVPGMVAWDVFPRDIRSTADK